VLVSFDLAAVVVTYNSAHVIEGLLDSMPGALGGLRATVIVVDNGSTDGTPGLVAARSDCRLIKDTNRGYAAGINVGIRQAGDVPAVLVLNPDVRMGPGSIPPLLAALQIPGTGITAPQIRTCEGGLEYSLRREPTILRGIGLNRTGLAVFSEYVTPGSAYARGRTADWALGAVLMMSRECLASVGEWDESFFLYSEETDYCLQARDLGLATRYVPESVAVHIGGQSGQSNTTHAMQAVNRVRLYRRRHRAPASLVYLAVNALSELSWALRGNSRSWFAVKALLRPRLRPQELGCSQRLLPG
jgi:N-acetylglucosaminyl-diphospho-decaprenol L-rhamnosyltransferase